MDSWRAGDRALAFWDADGCWYPATIVSTGKDGDIQIKYDDGDTHRWSLRHSWFTFPLPRPIST